MKEVIKKYFCNFCVNNKCENCMDIISIQNKNMLTYKCVNVQIINKDTHNEFDYIIRSDNDRIKSMKLE